MTGSLKIKKLITICAVAAMCTAFMATGNVAQAQYSEGDIGTLTVNAPNSLDGAAVDMWGVYTYATRGDSNSGEKSATSGSGTVIGGTATVNSTGGTDVDDQYLSGMGGTDLLMSGATVPEPATMFFLVLGGVVMLLRRKRQK
jgi:hypothetical protein